MLSELCALDELQDTQKKLKIYIVRLSKHLGYYYLIKQKHTAGFFKISELST